MAIVYWNDGTDWHLKSWFFVSWKSCVLCLCHYNHKLKPFKLRNVAVASIAALQGCSIQCVSMPLVGCPICLYQNNLFKNLSCDLVKNCDAMRSQRRLKFCTCTFFRMNHYFTSSLQEMSSVFSNILGLHRVRYPRNETYLFLSGMFRHQKNLCSKYGQCCIVVRQAEGFHLILEYSNCGMWS